MIDCHRLFFCTGDRKKSFNSGLYTKYALQDSSYICELDKRRNKKWVGDSKIKDV